MPADAVERTARAEVDVALVLAVDSSGSISEQRLAMQIHGYIDALRHPAFIEAIRGGRRGRIGLTYVTWTDARRQDQVVPWRVIADQAGAFAFAQAIAGRAAPAAGLDLDQRRHRFLRRTAARQRLYRDAAGDRHLG